jgi:hypothetical protein
MCRYSLYKSIDSPGWLSITEEIVQLALNSCLPQLVCFFSQRRQLNSNVLYIVCVFRTQEVLRHLQRKSRKELWNMKYERHNVRSLIARCSYCTWGLTFLKSLRLLRIHLILETDRMEGCRARYDEQRKRYSSASSGVRRNWQGTNVKIRGLYQRIKLEGLASLSWYNVLQLIRLSRPPVKGKTDILKENASSSKLIRWTH